MQKALHYLDQDGKAANDLEDLYKQPDHFPQ
jgi:hypothetical protein